MKRMQEMIQDPRTYIESVAKQDRRNVADAIADQGTDTTLRVCFGVSGEEFPARSLGYYASALAIQENYMPEAKLQVVFPINTACEFNGVSRSDSESNIDKLDNKAFSVFGRLLSPDRLNAKTLYDGELPSTDLIEATAEVIASEPKLDEIFSASANRRSSDAVAYVAAHILMHDTNPKLAEFSDIRPDELDFMSNYDKTRRVISIGAQSERPFYLVRIAARKANILPPEEQVQTGQIFTKHVLPPYLSCREGEPLVSDSNGLNGESALDHPVRSVQRDLEYATKMLADEAGVYTSMTEIIDISEYCTGRITTRAFI